MTRCEYCGHAGDYSEFTHPMDGVYICTGRYVCKDWLACRRRRDKKKAEDAAWAKAEGGDRG